MKFLKIIAGISVIITFALLDSTNMAYAQTPQQTLNQYIADLQKNPNDNALREKIIKHVQTMKQKPAVPEEAERFMARGTAAVKNAKDPNDFKDAVTEFEKATLSAPWLASAYYNLGIARDKAGIYSDAIRSLKLYLLASPDATDAKSVKTLIYEIEYKQEKAAKESSPAAIAEKKQTEYEVWLKKLDGVRFIYIYHSSNSDGYWTLDIRGNKVVNGHKITKCFDHYCEAIGKTGVWQHFKETTLNGREFDFTIGCLVDGDVTERRIRGKISEDGYSATLEDCNGTNTYHREK